MYKYKISIKKVSGRLNESVLPNKNLVINSKTKKHVNQIFTEAADYLMKKYGLVLESAEIKQDETGLMLDYVGMDDPSMDIEEMWDVVDNYIARGYRVKKQGNALILVDKGGDVIGKVRMRDTSHVEIKNPHSRRTGMFGSN